MSAPPPVAEKKKRRGYSVWRYLGWGSSSSSSLTATTTAPPLVVSEEGGGTVKIHDAEMLNSVVQLDKADDHPPLTFGSSSDKNTATKGGEYANAEKAQKLGDFKCFKPQTMTHKLTFGL